jgi:hypothetical protein
MLLLQYNMHVLVRAYNMIIQYLLFRKIILSPMYFIAGLHPQSPSSCMTTLSASLTNIMVFLPQSCYCSYHVRRQILAPPLLVTAETSMCTLLTCDISLGLPTLTAPEAGEFVELLLLYCRLTLLASYFHITSKGEQCKITAHNHILYTF